MRCALIIVLAAAVARAQFGSQAVATGASPGPSPTNSIGCHLRKSGLNDYLKCRHYAVS